MFFPGARRRAFHIPHAFVPFGLAIVAVVLTLVAWALFSRSDAGLENPVRPLPDIASIRSVAYTLPGRDFDDVVVRQADSSNAPRVIATFPNSGSTGYHIHGAASPLGDHIAVISLPPFASRASGTLSLVNVATGEVTAVDGLFDYFTRVSWAPDGSRLAVVRYEQTPSGRKQTVVEVDLMTRVARPVAEFSDALDVVPVGYSFDSQRLFVVAVDNKGSNLYMERGGKIQLESELSPGRTRDWALSPDGSRLAFVDVLAGGSRTFVGRTLIVATGAVTTLPSQGEQVGVSWMPGSPVPAFGGPGGSLQLSGQSDDNGYVVPAGWSPDANFLVATVFGNHPKDLAATGSLELVKRETPDSPSHRIVLSDGPGAAFLGWVRNLN